MLRGMRPTVSFLFLPFGFAQGTLSFFALTMMRMLGVMMPALWLKI